MRGHCRTTDSTRDQHRISETLEEYHTRRHRKVEIVQRVVIVGSSFAINVRYREQPVFHLPSLVVVDRGDPKVARHLRCLSLGAKALLEGQLDGFHGIGLGDDSSLWVEECVER